MKAADLSIRSINLHYPPNVNKTRYLLTKRQLDRLLLNLHLQNMGKTHIDPVELMF